MTTIETTTWPHRLIGDGVTQLSPSLAAHHQRHGMLPVPKRRAAKWSEWLLLEIERAGLTGRGGAGFPAFRKSRSGDPGRRRTIVVNAMEGEPASGKDRFLIASSPHLVLDGAELLARALHATRTVVCVPADDPLASRAVVRALGERSVQRGPAASVEIRELPGRYVAGEESALVAGAAGATALPRFRPDKSVPLRIGRDQALVHNVETLAHIALIARHGGEWFKQVGSPEAPGTCLVTVSGAVALPGVVEVPTGEAIRDIVALARPTADVQAVLVGGFGGTWLSGEHGDTPYAPLALRDHGASMGAGILVALPVGACGLRETEHIARHMASQSAGQCGPCLFGLPALATDLGAIADGRADRAALQRLLERCAAVDGRGACRHPDGVVRLIQSALVVFAADLAAHLGGMPCAGSARMSVVVGRPGAARAS